MAPKRIGTASKTPIAKRARAASSWGLSDLPEAPLLAFLATADMPKASREMLQVGLPLCLEVLESERHRFQVEVLDRVASLLADVESKRREAIRTVEVSFAEVETEMNNALANVQSKKAVASTKQSECDEKGKLVDGGEETAAAAQQVLTTARQQLEAFIANASEMYAERESFAKLLSDEFLTLKEATFAGNWQRKNKVIGELKKKMIDIGGQQSLADAMAAALKLKPEQRTGVFAKAAMQFVEECFANHTAKVSQNIAGLAAEEASIKGAIGVAESALTEKKGELQHMKKEWDELQDVWVKLEEVVSEATRTAQILEMEIPTHTRAIEKAKMELDKFLELPALFSKLRAQSTAAPEEPEPCPGEEDAAEEDKGAEEVADGEHPDEGVPA